MKNNRMEWQAKYLQAKYLLPDVRVVTQLHKPSKLFGPNCYASRWVYYKDNLISKSMYMTDLDKNDYYDRNAVNKLTEEETRKMDGSIFNSLSDEVQQEIYDDANVPEEEFLEFVDTFSEGEGFEYDGISVHKAELPLLSSYLRYYKLNYPPMEFKDEIIDIDTKTFTDNVYYDVLRTYYLLGVKIYSENKYCQLDAKTAKERDLHVGDIFQESSAQMTFREIDDRDWVYRLIFKYYHITNLQLARYAKIYDINQKIYKIDAKLKDYKEELDSDIYDANGMTRYVELLSKQFEDLPRFSQKLALNKEVRGYQKHLVGLQENIKRLEANITDLENVKKELEAKVAEIDQENRAQAAEEAARKARAEQSSIGSR